MTAYQIYTRLNHALTAKHWRGAAVHSPMMYDFIREVVMKHPRKRLIGAIVARYGAPDTAVADTVEELSRTTGKMVVLLREPFRSAAQRKEFDQWYRQTHVVVAHLQGLLVLFFDPKLQKQYYKIRN